jgi:polysaccharide biosynthesis/export protein
MTRILSLLFAILFTGSVQAQGTYLIKPGDTLRIEVLEDQTLNRGALVLPDGTISVPQAGQVQVAGRTVAAVQQELITLLSPSFAAPPSVFVGIDGLAQATASGGGSRATTIFVMGEALKTGKIEIRSGSTLLQVLAEIGGFTKFAAVKRIQIRRGAQTFVVNYKSIEDGTDTAAQMVIKSGDVILVPQRRLFE